ncbi:CHAT domain-containing protein [Okeania sp. KiyG1]|uniref:CHAT domain-containing protein n=1 Tax=Okeania sp. KiyG1 TaxID=2720165 RepID=UPI001F45859F|nr:CHAT domain-containing protein [Okeania sp. KiyG1]
MNNDNCSLEKVGRKTVMILDKLPKGDRALTFFIGLLFASSIPIPIIAQHSTIVMAQVSNPENNSELEDTQPGQGLGGQLAIFVGHQDDINSVKFSPDGNYILTASDDKTARLWDREGNPLATLQHDHKVKDAKFSPNGNQIITVSYVGIYLWDKKGNLLANLRGGTRTSKFSSDGNLILTTQSGDEIARLWDSNGNLLAKLQHEADIEKATFSPDGKLILTASKDGTARLWDQKGNLLTTLQHESRLMSVEFSPDGSHILTTAVRDAYLWDRKGNLLANMKDSFYGHGHPPLNDAKFSPDGRLILTSSDRIIRLWDREGNSISILKGHEDDINSVEFSRDGSRILTASYDKTARLWDNKGNLLTIFEHQHNVQSAKFSPDGNQIITTSWDSWEEKTTQLWDRKGNILKVFRYEDRIAGVEFSSDGSQILSWGDNIARLRNLSELIAVQSEQTEALETFEEGVAQQNSQLTRMEEEDDVEIAIFSPNGTLILTRTLNGRQPRLWDREGNLVAEFKGHKQSVQSGEFNPNSREILTTALDGTVRLWDRNGNSFTVFDMDKNLPVVAQFSPDGEHILISGHFSSLSYYLLDKQGNLVAEFKGRGAEFSLDGKFIITTADKIAYLWNRKGNLVAELEGHQHRVHNPRFSPDGEQIFTASYDKVAYLWNKKGNLLAEFQHEGEVTNVEFSPDGKHLLIFSYPRTEPVMGSLYPQADLWNIDNNSRRISRLGRVSSAEFSPDGKYILTVNLDNTASLWDSQGNLLPVSFDHKDEDDDEDKDKVKSAKFSPDGNQIFTTSDDLTVRLWDREGKLLAIFRGHNSVVTSAKFNPDGGQILSVSQDNTARLWDISGAVTNQAEQLAARQNSSENNNQQTAVTLLGVGNTQAKLGEFQKALDSYNRGLTLSQEAGAIAVEAKILNALGELYNNLAESDTALNYHNQALPLLYQLNDKGGAAITLNNIGDINAVTGKHQDALKSYNQAINLSQTGGEQNAEAVSLMGIGNVYIALQEWSTALKAYKQALKISRFLKDEGKETIILKQFGKVQAALGEESTALDYYNQALLLSRDLGYKSEEASILYNQATLKRQQNNLSVAQAEIETAIKIVEELRTKIISQDLRKSYFSTVQNYYQLYIDILMQLHKQNPDQGFDAKALHASERSRARSLLELLTEANANIREGVNPNLLNQEQTILQKFDATEKRRLELVKSDYKPEQLEKIKQELATLQTQYQQLQNQIKQTSPSYAALKYPQPLNLKQIQQQVLDDNTILLEYSLGKDRSYLWAVSKNSITSYELPPQAEIETAAQQFIDLLTASDLRSSPQDLPNAAQALSEIILQPVASQLENQQLLIVSDGILQYIPFAALPAPGKNTLLLANSKIVNAPSASTIAINRNQTANRQTAAKTITILADPVFSPDDERVTGIAKENDCQTRGRGGITAEPVLTPDEKTVATIAQSNNSPETVDLLRGQRMTRAARHGSGNWERLPCTRIEAEAIIAQVPDPQQRSYALDFEANKEKATNPELNEYQFVHFATHGFFNGTQPELSGIVMSLVDENGNQKNGFLYLQDVFNLKLSAELVVLSACETGLGEEVKGEGIVGLTRGFMYAGTPRVVVSLWKVDDEATAELMSLFYQKMLVEKKKPVEALRAAQIEMLNSAEWQDPEYWAAFTLQGEWQ